MTTEHEGEQEDWAEKDDVDAFGVGRIRKGTGRLGEKWGEHDERTQCYHHSVGEVFLLEKESEEGNDGEEKNGYDGSNQVATVLSSELEHHT